MLPAPVTPRRGWYVLAVLLVLAGLMVLPAAIILPILTMPAPVQFLVPGSTNLNLAEPGKYVLWHDTETIFNGRTYSGGPLPDGLSMELSNAVTSTIVPLVPDSSTTMSMGGTSRRSVASFAVGTPGLHVLRVTGTTPPMVFSFAKSGWGNLLWSLGMGFILCPSLILAGVVLGICVFARRRSRMNALRQGQASR